MVVVNPSVVPFCVSKTGHAFAEINAPGFLLRLRSGGLESERAFERLFRRTHVPLRAYIRRYFIDTGIIEDILQDTYLAVHRGLCRFESRCKLSTWIFSLARHKVFDQLAEKYRKADAGLVGSMACDIESRADGLTPLSRLEAKGPAPDEWLIERELVVMVEAAAAELPALYRDVHYLRDYEGMNGEETAEALAISKTLVRVRLHRARNLIARRIRSRFPQVMSENYPSDSASTSASKISGRNA